MKGPAQGDDSKSIRVMPFVILKAQHKARLEAVPVQPPGLCSPLLPNSGVPRTGGGAAPGNLALHTGLFFLCCCLDC